MSARIDKDRTNKLAQSTVDALWTQWAGLGAFVSAVRSPRSLVDPEALVITSLIMRERERRLWDVVASFARNGSKLLSVQRVKNLLDRFPEPTSSLVSEFSILARSQGSDFRWKNIEDDEVPAETREHELWTGYPSRWSPSALLLRLRLGFGVGIAADLLGYLLALQGNWATASDIADAVDYSVRPVRRSADNLAAAKMIAASSDQPTEYRVDAAKWASFLEVDGNLPEWRYWNHLFPFITHVLAVAEGDDWEGLSPYVVSSWVRDLIEDHEQALRLNQLNVPQLSGADPEEGLVAFNELMEDIAKWFVESV